MGENQFAKLMRKGRDGKLGMIKPTLEEPRIILEEAGDGDTTERASSYIFIRSFIIIETTGIEPVTLLYQSSALPTELCFKRIGERSKNLLNSPNSLLDTLKLRNMMTSHIPSKTCILSFQLFIFLISLTLIYIHTQFLLSAQTQVIYLQHLKSCLKTTNMDLHLQY